MQEAYLAGYWDEFTSFIRNLFNATFKSNPYMERAMMTGITRVSNTSQGEVSESIFFDFGEVKDIYNPWSICQFLQKKKFAPYWANTSSNGLVGELLRTGDGQIKTQFETLLQGGTLQVQLDEQIVFNQLTKKRNAIWSLFLASGYLKTVSVSEQPLNAVSRPIYELALTNFEVKIMFENMITDWFAEDVRWQPH